MDGDYLRVRVDEAEGMDRSRSSGSSQKSENCSSEQCPARWWRRRTRRKAFQRVRELEEAVNGSGASRQGRGSPSIGLAVSYSRQERGGSGGAMAVVVAAWGHGNGRRRREMEAASGA